MVQAAWRRHYLAPRLILKIQRNCHKIKAIAGLLFCALSATVYAQAFKAGALKYEKQDYVGAMQEWLPLAQQGDQQAQYHMGQA